MSTVWAILGSGSTASLITLWIKIVFDHRAGSRAACRELYVELLTLLASRRAFMQAAVFDPSAKLQDMPNERIDALNARLMIDATPAVKKRAQVCLELVNRFLLSRSMGAPVSIDEHGFYEYHFRRVAGQPEEARDMVMRVSLGEIADEFGAAVDALATQVRREIHGKGILLLPL